MRTFSLCKPYDSNPEDTQVSIRIGSAARLTPSPGEQLNMASFAHHRQNSMPTRQPPPYSHHTQNVSYSSNEEDRILYRTRRCYVRSRTKSDPHSMNSGQTGSSKPKPILYYVQATHNYTADSTQENTTSLTEGDYFAVVDSQKAVNGWLKCVRIPNINSWAEDCQVERFNNIVYIPDGFVKKLHKKVTIDDDKPIVTEYSAAYDEDERVSCRTETDSIPPDIPAKMPAANPNRATPVQYANSTFPDINVSARGAAGRNVNNSNSNTVGVGPAIADMLYDVRVVCNRPVLYYVQAHTEYRAKSETELALTQGAYYAVIRTEINGWLAGVPIKNVHTWSHREASALSMPIANFPVSFVNRVRRVESGQQAIETTSSQEKTALWVKNGSITDTAAQQKSGGGDRRLVGSTPLPKFEQSAPPYLKPAQASNRPPSRARLQATASHAGPQNPAYGQNARPPGRMVPSPFKPYNSIKVANYGNADVGQYKHEDDAISTITPESDGLLRPALTFNDTVSKYVPPKLTNYKAKQPGQTVAYTSNGAIIRPVQNRQGILRNYTKSHQKPSEPLSARFCVRDQDDLNNTIDILLLVLIIILAIPILTYGILLLVEVPELTTIPPVLIVVGILNFLLPIASICILKHNNDRKLALNPIALIKIIIINLLILNFILVQLPSSLNEMNFKLAKVFTAELLRMRDEPRQEDTLTGRVVNLDLRVQTIQESMSCCGFHTALDYCYPESVEYFSESQRSTKVAQEAFDDMLRATKDHAFMLKRYNECRTDYRPCMSHAVSAGCKIEILSWMDTIKGLIILFVVIATILWIIVFVKAHLLRWIINCCTKSNDKTRYETATNTTEETKIDDDNLNNNNNTNPAVVQPSPHPYRRNRNVATPTPTSYRPNPVISNRAAHDRTNNWTMQHRREDAISANRSISSGKSAYV